MCVETMPAKRWLSTEMLLIATPPLPDLPLPWKGIVTLIPPTLAIGEGPNHFGLYHSYRSATLHRGRQEAQKRPRSKGRAHILFTTVLTTFILSRDKYKQRNFFL